MIFEIQFEGITANGERWTNVQRVDVEPGEPVLVEVPVRRCALEQAGEHHDRRHERGGDHRRREPARERIADSASEGREDREAREREDRDQIDEVDQRGLSLSARAGRRRLHRRDGDRSPR